MPDLKAGEKNLHDEFVKGFIKDCGKKTKKYWVPGSLKSWGCKKAAERAWRKNKENVGDAIKKRKISGVKLFEIGDDIKLKF